MAVTAQLIKELRDRTGAGMMDCKKALTNSNANMDEAITWLRENGIAKAAKKGDRIAAEGMTVSMVKGNVGAIAEINAETDFVSQNDKFKALVEQVATLLVDNKPADLDAALALKTSDGTLADTLVQATATIGEKITLRRVMVMEKSDKDAFGAYIHMGGKISSLVLVEGTDKEEVAKDVAMHVAAINPKFVDRSEVSQDFIATETKILTEQAQNEMSGKPANIIENIVKGRMNKQLSEMCLNDQAFIKDSGLTVAKYVAQSNGKVVKMARFEVGEGIEKEATDFAAEVAAQVNSAK